MAKKDPYADSPYDASGMPLGADTVDYDVKEDVAAKTVFDKPVEHPKTILDLDYTPRPIDEKLIRKPEDMPKSGFNSAIDHGEKKAEEEDDFLNEDKKKEEK